MKFKNLVIIFFIFYLIIFTKNSLTKENKILIKVNNQIITTVDILSEIRFLSIINKDFEKIDKNKQIQIAKNLLIKEKIKTIELLNYKENLILNEEEFENIIKSYFANLEMDNIENYSLYFKEKNLDISYVKKKISVDTFWKAFIYQKFLKNVKIDETKIKKDIIRKEEQNEYMLSEIVFILDKNESLNEKFEKINKAINEKDFVEAALIYSVSDTSKNGGKLGWIKENILSKKTKNELRNIQVGDFTKPIIIPGGFLILKKTNVRKIKNVVDKDKEIKIIIQKQTNDQLDKLSNIYLNKLKKNIQINEI